jgi:hypothetical protein
MPHTPATTIASCRRRARGRCALIFLAALSFSGAARACELALVLAVDVSVSVDARDYGLQMAGIAQALRDPEVIAAIEATAPGGIAVTVVQWSSFPYHAQTIDWTHVVDRRGAVTLAGEIERSPRQFARFGTGIGNGLTFSSNLLESNPMACRRRVIDISGDGRNNEMISPADVRTALVARGIVINGLAVLDGDDGLADYYRHEVTGGPGSFVMEALGFEDFADAMKRKLLREIQPVLSWLDDRPVLLAGDEPSGNVNEKESAHGSPSGHRSRVSPAPIGQD